MARTGSKKKRWERERQERQERHNTCAKEENFELPMCVQMRELEAWRAAANAKRLAFVEHCRKAPFEGQCIGTSTESISIIAIIVMVLLCFCCCRSQRHHNPWN
jgi:hypothetical protein